MVNESNIGEVSIEQKDFSITIKQKEQPISMMAPLQSPVYHQTTQQFQPSPAAGESSALPTKSEPAASSNTITIKSPMIGTFYRRPAPDKPNFVEVGDEVAPGKVVCIIEAMKLFNEIESEVKGKIVKVLVEDATPVEYDQPLFLVDPSEA